MFNVQCSIFSLFIVIFFTLSFVALPVKAQTSPDELWDVKPSNLKSQSRQSIAFKSPREFRAGIAKAVFEILGIIAFTVILKGIFKYINSAGSEDKMYEGRNLLIKGSIGLIVVIVLFITIPRLILQ